MSKPQQAKILDRSTRAYLTLQPQARPGDVVKVNRKAVNYAFGWGNYWSPVMDKAVGATLVVAENRWRVEHAEFGIPLVIPAVLNGTDKDIVQCFPWFVLEFVERGNADYEKEPPALFLELIELINVDPAEGETFDDVELLIRAKASVTGLRASLDAAHARILELESPPVPTPATVESPVDVNVILEAPKGVTFAALPPVTPGKRWRYVPAHELKRQHTKRRTFCTVIGKADWILTGYLTANTIGKEIHYVEEVNEVLKPGDVRKGDVVIVISKGLTSRRHGVVGGMNGIIKEKKELTVASVDGLKVFAGSWTWAIEDLELVRAAPVEELRGTEQPLEKPVDVPATPAVAPEVKEDLASAVKEGKELLFIPNQSGDGGWDAFDKKTGKRIIRGAKGFSITRPTEVFDPKVSFGLYASSQNEIPQGCYYGLCGVPSLEFEEETTGDSWGFDGHRLISRGSGKKTVESVSRLFLGGDKKVRG